MNVQQEVSAVIAAPIPPPDTWRVLTDGEPVPLGYLMLLEVLARGKVLPHVLSTGADLPTEVRVLLSLFGRLDTRQRSRLLDHARSLLNEALPAAAVR